MLCALLHRSTDFSLAVELAFGGGPLAQNSLGEGQPSAKWKALHGCNTASYSTWEPAPTVLASIALKTGAAFALRAGLPRRSVRAWPKGSLDGARAASQPSSNCSNTSGRTDLRKTVTAPRRPRQPVGSRSRTGPTLHGRRARRQLTALDPHRVFGNPFVDRLFVFTAHLATPRDGTRTHDRLGDEHNLWSLPLLLRGVSPAPAGAGARH